MAEQHLHKALGPIDVLTRVELDASLHSQADNFLRAQYRGMDVARFPLTIATATATTLNLFNTQGITGPASGDIWMLRRVIVVSSVFATDTAKYTLFKGTAPSDIANGYDFRHLLDAQGLGGQVQSIGYNPGSKLVYLQPGDQIYALVSGATIGNEYCMQGEAIRCPAEMKGKIL